MSNKKFVEKFNEIPEDYKPIECKTCRVRMVYAKFLDAHFDYKDCPYECDVNCWQRSDGE